MKKDILQSLLDKLINDSDDVEADKVSKWDTKDKKLDVADDEVDGKGEDDSSDKEDESSLRMKKFLAALSSGKD